MSLLAGPALRSFQKGVNLKRKEPSTTLEMWDKPKILGGNATIIMAIMNNLPPHGTPPTPHCLTLALP